MNQIKDMPLSLKSDTFSSLASDFDSMSASSSKAWWTPGKAPALSTSR